MPSNEIKINGVVVYEVPDSFMGPLDAYLKMVREKTGQVLEEAQESRRKLPGWMDSATVQNDPVPVQNDSFLQGLVNGSLHMASTLTKKLGPILLPDDGTTPEAMESSPIVEAAVALHSHLEKLVARVDL